MTSAIPQKPRQAVIEILDFMRKHGLALDDLTAYGGEDLKSPDKGRAGKARHVGKTWALMAHLGMKYADLDPATPPAKPTVLAIPESQVERQRAWAQWYAKASEAYETELKKRQLKNPKIKFIDWWELPLIEDRVEDFLPSSDAPPREFQSAALPEPGFRSPAQRGGGCPPESPLFSTTYEKETSKVKSLENNKKTDDHSVGSPGTSPKGRWKHKRRLAPVGDLESNPDEGAGAAS